MTPKEERATIRSQAAYPGDYMPGKAEEIILKLLADLDEAEALATAALSTADGHREYGERMEAELVAVTAERDHLMKSSGNRLDGYREMGMTCARLEDERDAMRATCDQLREALERTQAELAAEVSDADIMRARDALARARKVT